MSQYPTNHFILFLQNNYTKQVCVKDVLNTSMDKLFYTFENITLPTGFPAGEYNYYLVWDILEYSYVLNNNILDTKITVTGLDGNTYKMKLKDLTPETGVCYFAEDASTMSEISPKSLDVKKQYYSL